MRRADRLFQIVQKLRRRRATTAAHLAEVLGVSLRTVYRDVQDLVASGVPIRGEAGVGYALDKGFDLPPLMFNEEEIEALVLGARIVKAWADPTLARAADEVLAKVEAVLPERLVKRLAATTLFAPSFGAGKRASAGLDQLRTAIKRSEKVRFRYQDKQGAASLRTVRPLGLFYWGQTWSLGAWCELRSDFRNFRLDRIVDLALTGAPFETEAPRSLDAMLRAYAEERRP